MCPREKEKEKKGLQGMDGIRRRNRTLQIDEIDEERAVQPSEKKRREMTFERDV